MTKQELIEYAKSVHLATTGEQIETLNNPSDHPFEGLNVDVMSEFVNGDLVKKFVKDKNPRLYSMTHIFKGDGGDGSGGVGGVARGLL